MSILRIFGYGIVILLCGVGAWGVGCTDEKPPGPKVCNYEHECGETGRCIYDDPTCTAQTGLCKGVCQEQEPIPERTCECQQDEDCKKFPAEGCAACKCVSRNVLQCKTDADCIRGWYCLGEPGKAVCQARSSCQKEEDCPFGYKCREGSCCDPETNNCPKACVEGDPCTSDVECYFCNMRCKSNKCTFDASDPCAGIKCVNDTDCISCSGKCAAGYCQASTTPTCVGKACQSNGDCIDCGSNCQEGRCQGGNPMPSCTTSRCQSDQDCTASGLLSCIEQCCR